MNELERAAHELVTRPQREPTPLAHLEARAAETRRRRVAVRALSAAAALLLVIAVLGLAARQRGDDVEVRLGSDPSPRAGELRVRATMGDAPVALDEPTLSVVRARLAAFGVTDAVITPDRSSSSFELRAAGITFDEARLLLETRGRVEASVYARRPVPDPATGSTTCTVAVPAAVIEGVGWPTAKPVDGCYRTSGATTSLNAFIATAQATADGDTWSVDVSYRTGVKPLAYDLGGCGSGRAPSCDADAGVGVGVLFDGVLLREPKATQSTPGANEEIEQADTGFVVHGFTSRDARLLAAILTGGALDTALHLTLLESDQGSAPSVTTTAPSPGTTADAPPSTTAPPSGPAAQLAFYLQGSDAAVRSSLDLIRGRFEGLGLHASFDVGAVLANGSGKRPVTLHVDNADNPNNPAMLEQLLLAVARPGVPGFAPVRSSQRISSHYPQECKVAAWGGECFMLGDGPSGAGLVSGARDVANTDLDVVLRTRGALADLVTSCRARDGSCPTGDIAFTVDGLVVGVVAADGVEPDADHVIVKPSQPLRDGALAEYVVQLLSGPMLEEVQITFSPDPAPGPLGQTEQTATTSPPTTGALPDTTLPAGESTNTAPGPGATAPVCGNTPPMTDGPNC